MRRTTTTVPEPTMTYALPDAHVEMRCFGRPTGDWTLNAPDDAAAMRIAAVLDAYDCGETFMPNPKRFNAAVVQRTAHGIWNERWGGGRILRGPFADGVFVNRSDGPVTFGVTSADCPTVVLHTNDRRGCVVMHAGRDSLVDRRRVVDGGPPRPHSSVIDAAMGAMRLHTGVTGDGLFAAVFCGIAAANFGHDPEHPTYGQANRKLLRHLHDRYGDAVANVTTCTIDLQALIFRQLHEYGVSTGAFFSDRRDTYGDVERDGSPTWASQRRDGKGRNLVLVTVR